MGFPSDLFDPLTHLTLTHPLKGPGWLNELGSWIT